MNKNLFRAHVLFEFLLIKFERNLNYMNEKEMNLR